MVVRATHVPTGTDIVVGPRADQRSQELMSDAHGKCRTVKGAGVLECREHDDDPALAHLRDRNGRVHGAWVYLRKFRDKWLVCHSPSGIEKRFRSHEIRLMTDQHRWQQDYYDRAAQHAGWRTEQEVVLDSGTRLDLVIHGSAGQFGVEVQHSDLTVPKVRARDRKADRAGITSVWSADRKAPPWAFKVAHVETNELPHGNVQRRRWPVTTGPRRIIPARCTPANFDRCWKPGARTFCGGWHPLFRPINAVSGGHFVYVDDIAEQVPAGDLVRLDTQTKQGVILVTAADREMWEHDFAQQVADRLSIRRPGSAARPCSYDLPAELLELRQPSLARLEPLPPARVATELAPTQASPGQATDTQRNRPAIAVHRPRPPCATCGQPLFLIEPGRTVCERCRLNSPSQP